jgi:hypothetical protein
LATRRLIPLLKDRRVTDKRNEYRLIANDCLLGLQCGTGVGGINLTLDGVEVTGRKVKVNDPRGDALAALAVTLIRLGLQNS